MAGGSVGGSRAETSAFETSARTHPPKHGGGSPAMTLVAASFISNASNHNPAPYSVPSNKSTRTLEQRLALRNKGSYCVL